MKMTKLTKKLPDMTVNQLNLSRKVGKIGAVLKKHSPEILLVVGIAGCVASGVLACKATLGCEDILDEHREKINNCKEAKELVSKVGYTGLAYSDKAYQKDLTVVYVQTAVDFIKLYGPAVSLGLASIACIVGSHGIMKKRNVALVAAYKAVEESFTAYRKRVVEEFGEEKDYMFKNGLHEEVVVEQEVDENGKTKNVKKTKLVGEDGASMYARYFDESSSEWSKTESYNFMFLRAQQNYWNDILKIKGHVFLNEVYDNLGLPRSSPGAMVGWTLGENGDNFIDFGIFEGNSIKKRDFVNGYERSILLDFNVDGVIYDLI